MKIEIPQITEKQPVGQNCSVWQRKQQAVAEMRQRYGSAEDFLKLFTPDLQIATARNEDRAYLGTAPTLETMADGYGKQMVIVWLCIQIENINNFAGVKDKMPIARQKELAALILAEYPNLKASEMLLFFHRLKCGRYGRFYGMVDALFITSSLLQFMEQRRTEIIRHREEYQRKNQAALPSQATDKCITWEEYIKQKQAKEKENNHG